MTTAPTTPWNIPLFGVGDTIGPLASVFNSQSNALNTALNSIQANAFGSYPTLALLNAAPGTTNGQHATVTADPTPTNNGDYVWSSAATTWLQMPRSALVPLIPTSVAAATGTAVVGASGRVTFTGASTVSLNGFASAAYDAYRVVIEIDSATAATGVYLRARNAGSDNSGAAYHCSVQHVVDNGTQDFTGSTNAGTAAVIGRFSTVGVITIDIHNLARTITTVGTSQGMDNDYLTTAGFALQDSLAYDGISITTTAATTLTGRMRVYGYNNL